jgi:tannase/feruloyl esterase
MAHRALPLLVSLLFLAFLALTWVSADAAGVPCGALTSLAVQDTTITSATLVAATATAPEHCLVAGRVDAAIKFELRLPTKTWNGKFYHAGGGGFVGSIPTSPTALGRGYAVIGTDTGHVGDGPFAPALDGSWALNNPEAQLNFGHRAVHVVTVAGKRILHAFYGRHERLAYFEGCSNGGRQAMQEAERYPTDFDGIIAGAPALDWVGTMTGFVWNEQATSAAPLSVAKVALLAAAVLRECDDKDGLMDGLISDPRRCRFDPKTLQCSAGDAPTCLTAGQVETVKRIYQGATSDKGRPLYFGWPRGHEDGANTGWPLWITGNGGIPPLQFIFADGYLKYFVFDPSFDLLTSDLESDIRAARPTGRFLNATNADLSDFRAAGGKLIMWHGWADAALTAFRSIAYLQEAAEKTRRGDRLGEFFRLFLAPGMHHCGGGPGPNTLDALSALESWVEHGDAPEQIIATHLGGPVNFTRPLCAYPKEATYRGRPADPNNAASFVCRVPRDLVDLHDDRHHDEDDD